jgi:hypothetical protein
MPATSLTETQWMLLSAASQRGDHCAMLPPRLRGVAAQKVVQKLLDLGLVEAVRARGDLPVWRREHNGCAMALRLTSRGLERMQALRGESGPKQDRVLEQEVDAKTEEKVSTHRRPARGRSKVEAAAGPASGVRAGSKQARVISMLQPPAWCAGSSDLNLLPTKPAISGSTGS